MSRFQGGSVLWREEAPLILASRSPARRAILDAIGIPFEGIPADIDERAVESTLRSRSLAPPEMALALARAKAERVHLAHRGRIVLGADQVLELGDVTFAKPANRAAAAEQLAELSGKTHRLHSALALFGRDGKTFEAVATARLTMRRLSTEFISLYLDVVGDSACASVGGYQIEALGAHLFEAIEGDHWTILGLPALPLLAALRRWGSIAT